MDHLRICEKHQIFGAVMDLIRLEYRVFGKNANVVQRLKSQLDIYDENQLRSNLFASLAGYYLLSLNDLFNACRYAGEICRLDGNYDSIKVSVNILSCNLSAIEVTSCFIFPV